MAGSGCARPSATDHSRPDSSISAPSPARRRYSGCLPALLHLRHRAAIRFQPDDTRDLRSGSSEGTAARCRDRRRAAGRRPVVLCLGGPARLVVVLAGGDRLHVRRPIRRPHLDHAALQHVHPARHGQAARSTHGLRKGERLPAPRIFVVDGSRRSSKANAFFTGMGRNKRIGLFDTLVERYRCGRAGGRGRARDRTLQGTARLEGHGARHRPHGGDVLRPVVVSRSAGTV